MVCPKCHREIPERLRDKDPSYCPYCAQALGLPCPYSTPEHPHRAPTVGDGGATPSHCPDCGRPFQSCPQCRRLASIFAVACPFCESTSLEEAGPAPWPSEHGPMDATRSWRTASTRAPSSRHEQVLNVPGAVRTMAFRHGYLVVATDDLVLAYTRDGNRWSERCRVPDAGGRADQVVALAIEAGWVLVLSRRRARALRLPDLTSGHTAEGGFGVQAADNGVWAYADSRTRRLMRGSVGETVDVKTGPKLPDGPAPMWDMAMSGERLAFAREDGVWWTNVARHAGNLERIPCDGSSWRRVLWVGPRLFALGADEGGVTLAWSDMQGGDARRLHGSYVPDMAEAGGYIVLMQTSGLERYPTAQPTQPCQRVGMRAAWSPRRFAAALMDGDQWAALVVAQQAGNYRLVHVGFPGGECQLIGITMSTEPVVCAAGELLVVSSLEGAASRIWTFSTAQEE